jgi:menaquinone-dependent protoporphyrinogen oxidase
MPKYLVVYASKYGSTKEVAQAIAEGLGADIEEAGEVKPVVDDCELVVLGSPIYAGDYLRSMVDYIRSAKGALANKRIAAFITAAAEWEAQAGLTGDDQELLVTQQDYADGLAELSGGDVVATRGFGGRLDPDVLDEHDKNMLEWFYRFLMRDEFKGFDLLDLPAAREWGAELKRLMEER